MTTTAYTPMPTAELPSKTTAAPKIDERGSALVVALMCMLALFAITFAATKIRVVSARDIEDKNAQASQYWQARSAAATVEASLINDIPSIFDAEMLRAQTAVGGYPLPAFDPPQITLNASRPVLNHDGSITSSNASECTSLLGNLNLWAQRKSSVAETYANSRGYGSDRTRVALFKESFRQQLVGAPNNSEPAYLLEYQIDAAAGLQGNARGRVRPSGMIMLGPAQPGCNTSVSLSANPTDIPLGSSSTLTVTYTNASHVWLTDQTGAIVPGTDRTGLTETSSSQTLTFSLSPIDNTTYRAQAEGSGCRAVSAEVTVIVNYPPPEIIQFSANPSCINRGQSATLNFQVRFASTINITGPGVNQTFPGNTGATVTSGTLSVTPTTDSTYTITATGKGGSTTATTSITVKQPFSIDQFTSDSFCVLPGTPVNLSWANTNAESATITDSTTGATVAVSPSSGTRSFTVNADTTYTLTVSRTGCAGVETLTRTVTVNTSPTPTATFAANPADIELGNPTVLQWNTTNASRVTITPSPVAGSGMAGPQTVSASGSLTITPSAINTTPGYTYTLTVTNDSCSPKTITQTALVKVNPVFVPPACPHVISFDGDSCIISGQSATLSWNVADADFVDINGPGVSQTFSATPIGTGSITVSPSADATYTITARRAGSCTAASPPFPTDSSFTVRVGQTPTVSNFAASPAAIDVGQTTRLTWNESSNLANVRITGSGGDTNTYTVPPGQRFLDVKPSSTSTYTIVVTSNDCKAQTATQSTTVTVGACPTIVSPFTASPSSITAGGTSTLQWNVTNAAQVLLDGTPVAPASTRTVSPASTTTYRLSAISSNGTCNIDQLATVTVTPCPPPSINSFTATPSTVLTGGNAMVRLAWSITDATGTGVTVNIPGIGTFATASGFVDITQPQSTTTYTLNATNGCGASSTASTQVTANPCPAPSINSFNATPNSVTAGGSQTVRLAWSISDPSGTGVSVNIPGVGTFATATGFVDIVQPQTTTTYSLTATAGCGASATISTTVTVNPGCTAFTDPLPPAQIPSGPEILYLRGHQYVTPCVTEPPFGSNCAFVDVSSAEFAWDTKNADNVTINGTPVPTSGKTSEFVPFVGITPATYSAHPASDTVYTMEAWNSANPAVKATMQVLIKVAPHVAPGDGPPIMTLSNDGINYTPGAPVSIPYDAFVLDSSFNPVRAGVTVDVEGVATGLPAQGTVNISAPPTTKDYKFVAKYLGRESTMYVTVIVENPNSTGPGWMGSGFVTVPGIVAFPAPAGVRMRVLSNGAINIRYIINGGFTAQTGAGGSMEGGSVGVLTGGFAGGFAELYKDGIPIAESVHFGFIPNSMQMALGEIIIPAAFVPNPGCGRIDVKFIGVGSATTGFFSSSQSAPVELFDTRTGYTRPDPFGNASFSLVPAWTQAAWQAP